LACKQDKDAKDRREGRAKDQVASFFGCWAVVGCGCVYVGDTESGKGPVDGRGQASRNGNREGEDDEDICTGQAVDQLYSSSKEVSYGRGTHGSETGIASSIDQEDTLSREEDGVR
jgi:hypothetical protein